MNSDPLPAMRWLWLAWAMVLLAAAPGTIAAEPARPPLQYILVNRAPGITWNQAIPASFTRESFDEIKRALPSTRPWRIRPGVAFIFSYFRSANEKTLDESLRRFLALSAETNTPVLVQLDGECWWDARPDLWNWWDKDLPGFDPANRENVEWSGWSSDDALKIAWRNWGQQIRLRPPPNLMSPRYRAACHQHMRRLIPIILQWADALPAEQKDLFVGIKVGWESSIGVNAWYYPDGNALLGRPAADDPTAGLKADELPGRGVATIGYAAVKTAGLRTGGSLTEADLAEIARRHMEDLSRVASELGVPREKLFTHGAAWKDEELLYGAAVNRYSCPGWSFYKHAADPRKDVGVQNALKRSDAPSWAAAEWLYQGPREIVPWHRALQNTLADPRCRFVSIFNWEGIRTSEPVLAAIREVLSGSAE